MHFRSNREMSSALSLNLDISMYSGNVRTGYLQPKIQHGPHCKSLVRAVRFSSAVEMTSLIKQRFLILSGDVEMNPGPLGQHTEDPLDRQCSDEHIYKIATLDFNLMVVAKRLVGPQLAKDIIDKVELSDQEKKDEVFEMWLKVKGPNATYKELVELFETLKCTETANAVRMLVTVNTQSDDPTFTFKNIINALETMVEWKTLGTQLDISAAKIKEIDINNRGQVAECKHDMVQFWLESDTSCSWKKMVDALSRCRQLVLAERIKTTYCPLYQGDTGIADGVLGSSITNEKEIIPQQTLQKSLHPHPSTSDSGDQYFAAPVAKKLKTARDESSFSSMEVSCDNGFCKAQQVFINEQKQSVSANYALNETFVPRLYQKESAQPGIEGKNYIISLPTGAGKTLIAAMIITNHLQKNPNGKVIFTVPNEHLAQQQQTKLEEYIPGIKVESVTGSSGKNIYPIVNGVNVIVCTMGKLHQEVCEGSLKVSQFTLMIVDECHHVIGNSPGVNVMKQYLMEKVLKRSLPQVVGMSASLGAGKFASFDKVCNHQVDICAHLDSIHGVRIVKENTLELSNYINTPDITFSFMTPPNADEPFIEILDEVIIKLENMIGESPIALKGTEEYQKWIQNETLAAELSKAAENRDRIAVLKHLLSYSSALDACLIFLCESATDVLDAAYMFPEDTATSREQELNSLLINVKQKLSSFAVHKNVMLQELEDFIHKKYISSRSSRGILFVATIDRTKHVCKWIENSPLLKPLVKAKPIFSFSRGGMTKSDQQSAIEDFKNGIFNLLVSTPVLEEGLDVPDCNFIIRYQFISNEISHRQAMGRARAKEGKMHIMITKGSNMCYQQMLQEERLKLADRATEWLYNTSQENLRLILEKKQSEIIECHQRKAAAQQRYEWADSSKVKIICKYCKIEACRGSDVYQYGITSPSYIVPRKDFETRYIKIEREKEKAYGGLYKLLCKNCSSEWGNISWWKNDGLESPVLKGKSFTLLYEDKTKSLQQWKKAPFEILPYSAFTEENVNLQED